MNADLLRPIYKQIANWRNIYGLTVWSLQLTSTKWYPKDKCVYFCPNVPTSTFGKSLFLWSL